MATTQYIGARYVPKFFENSATNDSTWAANTAYEPLTIVTWNGNSYTSKKAVPAGVGTPSANADYWVSTGMYNAQVEEIREQVQTLENDVSYITDDIWVAIWDSYGSEYVSTPSASSIFKTIAGRNDSNLINLVFPSCGFVNSTGGTTFLQGLNAYVNEHPELERNRVSKIIVPAGRNDYSSASNVLREAINTFVTTAKSNFPNAVIYLGYIANGKNDSAHGTKAQQMAVFSVFKDCNNYGAVYLDGVENILRDNSLMHSDGIHPNSNGNYAIAKGVYNSVMCGSVSPVHLLGTQAISALSGYTVTNNFNINSYAIGETTTIITGGFTIGIGTPISIPATGLRISFGQLAEDAGVLFYPYGTIVIPVSVTINATQHYALLRVTSDMTVQLHVYPSADLTNVSTIYVRDSVGTYPTVYA